MQKKLQKKDAFGCEVDSPLVSTRVVAPKNALSNLSNDTQEGAPQVALKGAFQVSLKVALEITPDMHLYCACCLTH